MSCLTRVTSGWARKDSRSSCGWWYLRNLIRTGNPVPQVTSIGPFDLPGPEQLQVGRPDFSVAHYLTDGTVWKDYFLPGLDQGFGPAWPLLMALVFVGPFDSESPAFKFGDGISY